MPKNDQLARALRDSSQERVTECGLVMPISSIDGCPESHWSEVGTILSEAIRQAGFAPRLVSDADDTGIIHKRIVQNLYENEIVVCDVSGKNPNVMFELGLRLAFDKATVIVKDDETSYSFDTSPIEHVGYPRDLRYSAIVEFKAKLKLKVEATYRASREESYSPFLQHFGPLQKVNFETQEVGVNQAILEEVSALRRDMSRLLADGPGRRESVNSDLRLRQDVKILVDASKNPDRLWGPWNNSVIVDLVREQHPLASTSHIEKVIEETLRDQEREPTSADDNSE